MLVNQAEEKDTLEITNFDPEAIVSMIKFFYTDHYDTQAPIREAPTKGEVNIYMAVLGYVFQVEDLRKYAFENLRKLGQKDLLFGHYSETIHTRPRAMKLLYKLASEFQMPKAFRLGILRFCSKDIISCWNGGWVRESLFKDIPDLADDLLCLLWYKENYGQEYEFTTGDWWGKY